MSELKRIVIRAYCGLCNRLGALAGVRYVASRCNLRPGIDWRASDSCPGKLQDLFQVPDGVDAQEYDGWHRGWKHVGRSRVHEYQRTLYIEGSCSTRGYAEWPTFIGRTYAQDEDLVCSLIRDLKPREEIQARIEELVESWPDAPMVGVHVRRTDLKELSACGAKAQADARLVAQLSLVPEDHCFFVAADNPESGDMLRGYFGARVRQQNKTWLPSFRQTDLSDAVVDLYALARTTRIIGTDYSSFSYYASDLGGISLTRV